MHTDAYAMYRCNICVIYVCEFLCVNPMFCHLQFLFKCGLLLTLSTIPTISCSFWHASLHKKLQMALIDQCSAKSIRFSVVLADSLQLVTRAVQHRRGCSPTTHCRAQFMSAVYQSLLRTRWLIPHHSKVADRFSIIA